MWALVREDAEGVKALQTVFLPLLRCSRNWNNIDLCQSTGNSISIKPINRTKFHFDIRNKTLTLMIKAHPIPNDGPDNLPASTAKRRYKRIPLNE